MKATRILLFLSVSLLFLLPLAVGAQGLCEDEGGNPIPCRVDLSTASGSTNIGGYIRTIYNSAVGLGVLAALVMITAGGVMYAVSGVINKKQQGKDFITGALGGLTLLLGAYVILNVVNPELVTLDNPERVDVLTLSDSFGPVEFTDEQRGLLLASYNCPAQALDPYIGSETVEFNTGGKTEEQLEAIRDEVRNILQSFNVGPLRIASAVGGFNACAEVFGTHAAVYFTYQTPHYVVWDTEIVNIARRYDPSAATGPSQLEYMRQSALNEIKEYRDRNIKFYQFESLLLCAATPIKVDSQGGNHPVPRRVLGDFFIAAPEDLGNSRPENLNECPHYHNPFNAPSPFEAPSPPY